MTQISKRLQKYNRKREKLKTFLMKPFYRLEQYLYDRKRHLQTTIQLGKRALTSNVVILIIYQPNGISSSTFHTLENIKSEGFSAFVVLNSYISDFDHDTLRKHCALIMKRPNFGYDFGGYRDAILHLATETKSFKSITCMNDSVWFPVFKDCDHLSQMFNISGNLVGYSRCAGLRENKANLQSYLFMFKGEKFLQSGDFIDYWRRLRIANSRHFTIRNCELKIMAYFQSLNYQVNWLFSSDNLVKYYETSSDQEVVNAVNHIKATNQQGASLFMSVAEEDVAKQRDIIISGIASSNLFRSVMWGEPRVIFQGLKFAALKKGKGFVYQKQRKDIVDVELILEFEASTKKDVVSTYWSETTGF